MSAAASCWKSCCTGAWHEIPGSGRDRRHRGVSGSCAPPGACDKPGAAGQPPPPGPAPAGGAEAMPCCAHCGTRTSRPRKRIVVRRRRFCCDRTPRGAPGFPLAHEHDGSRPLSAETGNLVAHAADLQRHPHRDRAGAAGLPEHHMRARVLAVRRLPVPRDLRCLPGAGGRLCRRHRLAQAPLPAAAAGPDRGRPGA